MEHDRPPVDHVRRGVGWWAGSAFFPRTRSWPNRWAPAGFEPALGVTALVCIAVMRDAPAFAPRTEPVLPKLKAAARLRVTWEMSFLYAVVFGGFVAFSN
ncbi:hypothetical protein RW1_026_01260 [Rhodococcus wratislaviensis NBRC 100605]|uniref:Uncharacterized protein n=1 Tax=Rhodococcus wratislaviensis NBRC 100605 TaxID=1219028 RepID=X0Q5E8_RHOWR|nr:hypothetical protein [Rhodococcus sp. JS3073]GAF45826.1 hypothetical protein RW1_026_01260 [Rhodococcus wratislaviensis NBRC 100605]